MGDPFVEFTNFVGGLCCMPQLLLFFLFPDDSQKHVTKSHI